MNVIRDIFKTRISQILTSRYPLNLGGQGKDSAVLMPLFWKDGQCHLLLTKRTQCVEHHKGEISFPGGAREVQDTSLQITALRETQEETGICSSNVEILGKLDDTLTVVSNFVIAPFVGWIPYPYLCRVNPLEIEEVLEIPLLFFLEKKNYWKGGFRYQHRWCESHFYKWQPNQIIWGATGRIIYHFCEVLQNVGSFANMTYNNGFPQDSKFDVR